MAKIRVEAQVNITIPEADLEYTLGWKEARAAKREAAEWLQKLDPAVLPEDITVRVTLEQRSPDDPFIDGAPYFGKHHKEFALEYGVKFLRNFSTWGRGR